MGLAPEPIHGVAADFFLSFIDILFSDPYCFTLQDEWPVVADIVV